jgi:hypothetical protein
MNTIADAMATGGGRAKMDKFYATKIAESIKKNFQDGKYIRGILKTPFAVVEQAARPIMEYIVPRQKLGVFADMMKAEMERKPNMTHEELRTIAQKAWRSVDNRMGQLVYDNLFWNKTLKDLSMASVRSLGWNLGTIREIGGGIGDVGRNVVDVARGKPTEMSYRTSYIIALPLVTGIAGAIYQYLHTGKAPEEIKDYFFPKTGGTDKNGEPARAALPTYMKDVYHYTQNPVQTILNKFNPVNNALLEMYANKDFYGTKIRNEDDPLVQQALDVAKFGATQFLPFGIRNLNRDTRKSIQAKVEPFIGITPAPYDINMTPTEKKAREIMGAKAPVGGKTKEKAEQAKLKSKLLEEFKTSHDKRPIVQAEQAGKITDAERKSIYKEVKMVPLQRYMQNMSNEEIGSLAKTANEEEMKLILSRLNAKYKAEKNKPIEREKIIKMLPKLIARKNELDKESANVTHK